MPSKLPAVLAVSAAVLLLAGCASSSAASSTAKASASASSTAGSASSTCTPPKDGSTADAVKVSGAATAEPTVTFAKDLKATDVERAYVTKGTGAVAKKGTTVDVALVVYNGTSGAKLTSNGFAGTATIPITVGDSTMIPGLTDAVECAPVGSRLVTTATAGDAWGQADPSALGSLKATDTVVFVADIVDVIPERADGAPQPTKSGFPTVKLAADGKPTITIGKNLTPPTSTQVELLKKGTGTKVASGDEVTLQYQGVNWRTGKVFDQSWGRGLSTLQTTGVVAGFSKALVGETVGSQVLAVIPPADGYGSAGQSQAGIKGTDTIVFVIDILKTQH